MPEKDFRENRSELPVSVVTNFVDGINPERMRRISPDSDMNPFLQTVIESVSREIDVSKPTPNTDDSSCYITDVYQKDNKYGKSLFKRLIVIENPNFDIVLLGLFPGDGTILHPRKFRIALFSGKKKEDQKDSVFRINYRSSGLEMEELTQENSGIVMGEIKKASSILSRKKSIRERAAKRVGKFFDLYGRTHEIGYPTNKWS